MLVWLQCGSTFRKRATFVAKGRCLRHGKTCNFEQKVDIAIGSEFMKLISRDVAVLQTTPRQTNMDP